MLAFSFEKDGLRRGALPSVFVCLRIAGSSALNYAILKIAI